MENKIPFTALAIDYGTRNVGVAVGQSLTGTATPLPELRHSDSKNSTTELLTALNKIIQEWRPKKIVLGWPLNMDGSESLFCQEVLAFRQQLGNITDVPIELMDERLTSHAAKEIRQQNSGFREKPVDSLAASILLENWFNQI